MTGGEGELQSEKPSKLSQIMAAQGRVEDIKAGKQPLPASSPEKRAAAEERYLKLVQQQIERELHPESANTLVAAQQLEEQREQFGLSNEETEAIFRKLEETGTIPDQATNEAIQRLQKARAEVAGDHIVSTVMVDQQAQRKLGEAQSRISRKTYKPMPNPHR